MAKSQLHILIYVRVVSHKLFGELGEFCEHDAQEDYRLYVGETIKSIQKDVYIQGALLAVIHRELSPRSYSSLYRIYNNGTRQFLAGALVSWPSKLLSFSSISSVLQLNESLILIADKDYRCICSLNIVNNTRWLDTFSGMCSDFYKFTTLPITGGGEDGDFYNGTYTKPTSITKSPFDSAKLLITDANKIRELDIATRVITTVYHRNSSKFSMKMILWKDGVYLVASNEGVHIYSKEWKFQRHLAHRKISSGGIIRYPVVEHFNIADFTQDIIVMEFTYFTQLHTNHQSHPAAVIFSIRTESAIATLYDNSAPDSLLSAYPRSLTRLRDQKLGFIGYDGKAYPAHCSLIKTIILKGMTLLCTCISAVYIWHSGYIW